MWLLLLLVSLVQGDVYLHNPRGSNDRNCERNVNRNNGNRLFDSQNNAKGGYACARAVANSGDTEPPNGLTPKMKFEEGSKLEVEWTAQHGCGRQEETAGVAEMIPQETMLKDNANVHCEIVLQLACATTLDPMQEYSGNTPSTRTGATTDSSGLVTFTEGLTPNGLIAVPREGIPNSDGDAATNRIGTTDPGAARLVKGQNEAQTLRSAVHETPEFYNECNRVKRNRGLFTADQNVNRRSAIGTRQNPNGGRRGLECPEERDYYPYWRPSPFLDVAYLVDDDERCGTGTVPCGGGTGTPCTGPPVGTGDWVGEAQGLREYGSCVLSESGKVPKTSNGLTGEAQRLYNRREWPSTPGDCATAIAAQANAAVKVEWKNFMFHPQFLKDGENEKPFVAAANKGPECKILDYSRSNHLGNSGVADTATRYTMTIPAVNPSDAAIPLSALEGKDKAGVTGARTLEGEPCFLRIRYNMSSSDYARDLDSAKNGDNSPIEQDPLVEVKDVNGATLPVQLALNTNQVARTFQDRSYVFYIVPRPNAHVNKEVWNVNVRGKRGNIVQTYPAVEYDLIPNIITVDKENMVLAMQWQGSDYNPQRGCNDGEGGPYIGNANVRERLKANNNLQGSNQNSRTDRTTLLEMDLGSKRNYPKVNSEGAATLHSGTSGFAMNSAQAKKFLTANAENQLKDLSPNLKCLTTNEINNINNENRRENHPRNCAEGNALSPYFSTEFVDFTGDRFTDAQYVLYSARNNNFSNRDTKLKVFVKAINTPELPTATIGEYQQVTNPLFNDGLTYSETTGSYDSDATIEANSDTDIIGFDPVENDDYGEGATEGCTQDMLIFDGASSQFSHLNIMVFCFSVLFALF